jgi:WD40 repeat protein
MLAALVLFAGCLAPPPASAADAPPADGPRLLAKLAGPAGMEVVWSSDGRFILTAGSDGARVWDAQTYKPLTEPLIDKDMELVRVCWPRHLLLTLSRNELLWDLRTGKPLDEPAEQANREVEHYAAALNHDGSLLTRGSIDAAEDGTYRVDVWQLEPRRRLHSLRHDNLPDFALFSRDGKRFVLLDRDRFVVLEASSGKELGRNQPPPRRTTPLPQLHGISFSADGRRILTHGHGLVEVWDASTLAQIGPTLGGYDAALNPNGTLVAADFLPDPRHMHMEFETLQLAICEVSSGREALVLDTFRAGSGRGPIRISFSPDGKRVAAGFASDGYTAVWDVPGGMAP